MEILLRRSSILRIYVDYQSHALSEKALYQAGRSAMRTHEFTVAIERFSELVRVYSESDHCPKLDSLKDALTNWVSMRGRFWHSKKC